MAKVKNKKVKNSEVVSTRKQRKAKPLNPFEMHINKEKMRVLGRKLKNDRGLPGVSRGKAVEKRKRTLLREYEDINKTNKFSDKRIGERNNALSLDDKNDARYTAIRMKQHTKKTKFNLADDEVLTHGGQTLAEIEKFDDPRSDDENDDDDDDGGRRNGDGKLERKFVAEAHFGGGMLKKVGPDGAKSHKDLIDQLIIESKKRKIEKQKQKEVTVELTEKLDSEWKDLMPLVNKLREKTDKSGGVQGDDYDMTMRSLKFEARGVPSDRLKTEDEIAVEEKEKLETLERDRLARMRGVVDSDDRCKHRGADDLDDDYAYEAVGEDNEDNMLAYNEEGQANVHVKAELNGKVIEAHGKSVESDESADEHDDDEGSNSDDVDNKDVALSEGEEEQEDENSDEEDNFSDLKQSESESEEENFGDTDYDSDPSPKPIQSEIDQQLTKLKELMDTVSKELPISFTFPNSYDDLKLLLINRSGPEHEIVLERLIKCTHPSLAEGNKEKLNILFVYLLQYTSDLADSGKRLSNPFGVFKHLIPIFYDLAHIDHVNTLKSLSEVLKEKQSDYRTTLKISVDVLMFLRVVSCVCSTSDFRHHVATPAIVFVEQMLTQSKVRTVQDIIKGLFLVTIMLEFTTLSKRFSPATINFLAGVFHSAVPKSRVKILRICAPFKSILSLLAVSGKCTDIQFEDNRLETRHLFALRPSEDDDSLKLSLLTTSLKLTKDYMTHFEELPSRCEIFNSIKKYILKIPVNNLPHAVRTEFTDIQTRLNHMFDNRKLTYIVMPQKRPKALRLYEPNIQPVYDHKTHRIKSKEKMEHDKLVYKLKQEKKGALREIRRDRAFLSRYELNSKIKNDMERREKVKRIFADANIQQSELNSMDRANKRKRK